MSARSPTATLTANAVDENAANGTAVGVTALAADADATNNTITYTLDDNAGGRFAIDGSTGVVTVADGTSLEPRSSGQPQHHGASRQQRRQLEHASHDDQRQRRRRIRCRRDHRQRCCRQRGRRKRGQRNGGRRDRLATDADATNNTITYTLDDNAGGRFAIDGSTGVVTVADGTLLDREAAASHNITVRAASSDGSSITDQVMTININDVDEFDVGPVTRHQRRANAVDENATIGTVVGVTALASDADATNNTITYTLDDNDGGRFAIDV